MSNRNRPDRGRGRSARSRGRAELDLFQQALAGESLATRRAFDPATDRKTLQLCRQVQRALMLALGGECSDDLLREVSVDSVTPAGSAGHLLVHVTVPLGQPVVETIARLNDRVGHLRAIIASSICRKRVPMLSFIAIPTEYMGGRHD